MNTEVEHLKSISQAILEKLETNDVDVPMLPEVAGNVVSLTQNPDSDASDLAKLIQADQTLAAHVMRVANSAAYSPNASIVSLQQALARLGMQTITEIALAASINSSLFNTPGFEGYVNYVIKCSLASALWAKETARACRKNVEAAFLAALLNDIGRPVTVQLAIEEADKLGISLSREDILELEKATKKSISVKVVEAWEMPIAVKEVIHHFDCYHEEHSNQLQTQIVVAGTLIGHHYYCDESIEVCPCRAELAEHPVFPEINLYENEVEQLLAREEAVKSAMEAMAL
jgi:HD-like signal output (HDOD) protein